MRAEHDGDDAGLAPACPPLRGTPSVSRRIGQVRSSLQAVAGTLRAALQGPWQRERQRIRAQFGAQGSLAVTDESPQRGRLDAR